MSDVNQIIGIINRTPQHSCIEHIGIASAILSIVLCCMRTGIVFTAYTRLKAFNSKQMRPCVWVGARVCVRQSLCLAVRLCVSV